ncbi:hypothetical protein DFO47_105148 [Arthrobacter sp. AG258]|nr:hypothetical protein DFO47_105148 [Arthrobacter sp. AG258]
MGIEEDAAVVRRGYEAINTGDVETLKGLFTRDAVYRAGRTGSRPGRRANQFRSKRSSSMTFAQAATKSLTNFSAASSLA